MNLIIKSEDKAINNKSTSNCKEISINKREKSRNKKLNLRLIFNDVSGFYKILAVIFGIITIAGVSIHIKYTIPQRQDLKQNLAQKAIYISRMKALDTRIQHQNEKALTYYIQHYFTSDEIREIIQKYTKYEIKVNGEKINAANMNYNTGNPEVLIEISAQFNDEIYPLSLFTENCPLKLCPDGKEIAGIISIHTTKAKYTFETENYAKKHTYIYKITELAPGEVITLQINDPQISTRLDPVITKLEVTRRK